VNDQDETGSELALADDQPREQSKALADLRSHAMATTPEAMRHALAEYSLRRNSFRVWLREQLIEGVHFGFPPGCEPKGNVNPKQWVSKPSLYQSGADFVVDLMGLRSEYQPDMDGWVMAGSIQGCFVYKCELFSRANGELVSEGRGSSRVGGKRDTNGAVKMAMKCAKVSAVINAYGLSDLFTQDLENPPDKEEHEVPGKKTDATKTQPRGKRVTPDQLKAVCVRYRTWITNDTLVAPTPEALAEYASQATGAEFTAGTVLKSDNWTQELLKKFSDEVAKHEPPEGM